MSQQFNSNAAQNNMTALKPMIIGAIAGFILISMFVFPVKDPNPEWGSLWMIQPLIVTPLVATMGGLFYFLVNLYGAKWGFNKYLTVIMGIIGFIISLWMGFVLGLNGTMWN
jgi:hypothetical protein